MKKISRLHRIMGQKNCRSPELPLCSAALKHLFLLAICAVLFLGAGKNLSYALDYENNISTLGGARSTNASITHTYDTVTKTLTITGNGPMDDYPLNPTTQKFMIYPAWYGCYAEAEKIIIGNGITYVGEHAFYELGRWCASLKEVVIGDSVVEIADQAFGSTPALEKMTIGKSLKSVGYFNFEQCNNLTQVHISDLSAYCGINYISCPMAQSEKASLYLNGKKITDLVVPEGIAEIGNSAFSGCNLNSITLPQTIVKLGRAAFSSNPITAITIPNGVTALHVTFAYCKNLTDIVIPNNVTVIGERTFYGCSNLRSITLPSSITAIGSAVFFNCSNLESIALPSGITTIESSTFYGCSNLKSITLPSSITTIEPSKECGITGRSCVYR